MRARATVSPPNPLSNIPIGRSSTPGSVRRRPNLDGMSDLTLWHNPRCSKSRQAKQLLDDSGALYEERRYLDEPPTADELTALLDALGLEPWDITRMGEDVAKALDLKALPHDRGAWIDVLV